MSRFIKQSLLFFGIILCILFALEITVRFIPNDYSYKSNYLKKHADSIQILSFGSSHGLNGIDPTYFLKNGFNVAHSSQSLDYDYVFWGNLKDELENLETVILPISYFTLFSSLDDNEEEWRTRHYRVFYDFPKRGLGDYFVLSYQKPLAIAKMIVKLFLGRTNLTVNEFGANKLVYEQSDLDQTGITASIRHTKELPASLEINIAILSRMIEECTNQDVKVILLTTPTTDYYWSRLDQDQLDLMYSTLDQLLATYPQVVYYDLLKDPRFDYSDFRDADHLAPQGAEKLSRILDVLMDQGTL